MKPYRTIRRGPSHKPTKAGAGDRALVGFLNSPFGLWLLSTLFISVGSFAFTEWRQSQTDQRSRQDRIERLDLEIADRLDYANHWDHEPFSHGSDAQASAAAAGASLPAYVLLRPAAGREIYPEFRGRSVRSLAVELHSLLLGVESPCVYRAVHALRNAEDRWLVRPLRAEDAAAFRADMDRIANLRWSLPARQRRERGEPSCE